MQTKKILSPEQELRIEKEIGRPVTKEEIAAASYEAQEKLKKIISIEGDAGGKRLEPWYFEMLVQECLRQSRAAKYSRTLTEVYKSIENESMETKKECHAKSRKSA